MKKIIKTILVLIVSYNFTQAQSIGTPNGNTSFFNTNAQGKLLGHKQTGTFGNFGNNDRWIGIGKPTQVDAYGIRIQDKGNAGIFALTGTGNQKKLELNWGGQGKTANFEINHITSLTNPNAKTNCMTIKKNGDIGIGVKSPEAKLDIRTTSTKIAQFIQLKANSASAQVIIRGSRNACKTCDVAYIDMENFDDNEANGNRLYRLARLSAGMETNSGKNGYLRFYTTNANVLHEQMRIKSNGFVGIGKTNPAHKLDVAGNARVISLFQSSDKRFKKDIQAIDNPLIKIKALNGFTYQFKNEIIGKNDFSKTSGERQLGFLAQDVQKVFPELVSEDSEGYLSVNYIGLIPVLVEALKEQQNVAVKQESEIEDLKSNVKRLEVMFNGSKNIQERGTTLPIATFSNVVLKQNFPNPINNVAEIEYQIPEDLNDASLVVYDLNGKTIATYSISGKGTVEFAPKALVNGTYVYAIVSKGKNIVSQKMIIQK